jgi:Kelch motif
MGGSTSKDSTYLKSVTIAEAYSPCSADMIELPSIPGGARSYAGAAAIGRSIYIVGGTLEGRWLNTATRMDLDTLTFTEVIPPYFVPSIATRIFR